jgi:hypothetical protein
LVDTSISSVFIDPKQHILAATDDLFSLSMFPTVATSECYSDFGTFTTTQPYIATVPTFISNIPLGQTIHPVEDMQLVSGASLSIGNLTTKVQEDIGDRDPHSRVRELKPRAAHPGLTRRKKDSRGL